MSIKTRCKGSAVLTIPTGSNERLVAMRPRTSAGPYAGPHFAFHGSTGIYVPPPGHGRPHRRADAQRQRVDQQPERAPRLPSELRRNPKSTKQPFPCRASISAGRPAMVLSPESQPLVRRSFEAYRALTAPHAQPCFPWVGWSVSTFNRKTEPGQKSCRRDGID